MRGCVRQSSTLTEGTKELVLRVVVASSNGIPLEASLNDLPSDDPVHLATIFWRCVKGGSAWFGSETALAKCCGDVNLLPRVASYLGGRRSLLDFKTVQDHLPRVHINNTISEADKKKFHIDDAPDYGCLLSAADEAAIAGNWKEVAELLILGDIMTVNPGVGVASVLRNIIDARANIATELLENPDAEIDIERPTFLWVRPGSSKQTKYCGLSSNLVTDVDKLIKKKDFKSAATLLMLGHRPASKPRQEDTAAIQAEVSALAQERLIPFLAGIKPETRQRDPKDYHLPKLNEKALIWSGRWWA